jgi:hypothetical protein
MKKYMNKQPTLKKMKKSVKLIIKKPKSNKISLLMKLMKKLTKKRWNKLMKKYFL